MSRPITSALAVAVFTSFALAARADVVTEWNSAALDAIRADRTSPPPAARFLAILHVAIYDSVNGVTQTHEPYFVKDKPAGVASAEVAASAAAHRVLAELFPSHVESLDALYASKLDAFRDHPSLAAGIAWGETVARARATIVASSPTSRGPTRATGCRRRPPLPPPFCRSGRGSRRSR